jgi:hypothetical protein
VTLRSKLHEAAAAPTPPGVHPANRKQWGVLAGDVIAVHLRVLGVELVDAETLAAVLRGMNLVPVEEARDTAELLMTRIQQAERAQVEPLRSTKPG